MYLYLKRLIVGGVDRVFEIGKVFRNEGKTLFVSQLLDTKDLPLKLPKGIDQSHNPEFSSCEFYQAYGDFEQLIKMTEDIVTGMVKTVSGQDNLVLRTGVNESQTIVLNVPFARLSFVDTIAQATNFDLHGLLKDSDSVTITNTLAELCQQCHLPVVMPYTAATLLDKLGSLYVEPLCDFPTFITHHPLLMSPLAKANKEKVRHG